MKILIVVANYGSGNDGYLQRVLDEYREMPNTFDVDIVVTSNIAKDLGPDVRVAVGLPTKNPLSLPFAHKRIFADNLESYDLFIYTEDDILITKKNIEAFLKADEVLKEDENAALFRTEVDPQGRMYYPDVHHQYRWDATSVCQRGPYTFAFFTNEHSGCYALKREQLRRVIETGRFLSNFHEGKHPPLESAATDPYLRCGLRKLVCISHLQDFSVPHLSNKYAGKGILPAEEFHAQIKALLGISKNGCDRTTLFPVDTKLYHGHWSKDYYEPVQEKLLSLVPQDAGNVLSVGCGWGATEEQLIKRGMKVTAVPVDAVIGVNAEARGIPVIYGGFSKAIDKLRQERFGCLLLSNVLHLVENPVDFLSAFFEIVQDGGSVVASAPNVRSARLLARRIRFGEMAVPTGHAESGMHKTNATLIQKWFREAGFKPGKASYEIVEDNKRTADQFSLGIAERILGSSVYVVGRKVAETVKNQP